MRRSPQGGVVRRSRAALPLLGVAVEVPVRAPGRFVAAPQRSAVRAPVSAEAGLGSPAQRGPGVATEPVGVLAQGCAVPLGVLACPGVLCGLAPSLSASCLAPASLLATRFSTGSVLWRRLLLNTHGSNRKGTAQGCRSIRELHPSFLSHPTPLAGLLHEPSQPCVLPHEPRLPSLSITLCAISLATSPHLYSKLFFFPQPVSLQMPFVDFSEV